jgi:hypothetical protein
MPANNIEIRQIKKFITAIGLKMLVFRVTVQHRLDGCYNLISNRSKRGVIDYYRSLLSQNTRNE